MKKESYGKLLVFFIVVILGGLYHAKVAISSDTTTTLPMSMDLLRGNVGLAHWVLGTNNFYFTEIWIYAIGLLFHIPKHVLISWVPAIFYGILLFVSLEIVYKDKCIQNWKKEVKIVFYSGFTALLVVVPCAASYTLLNANSHNNLYAFLAIYILCILNFLEGKRIFLIWASILAIMMSISESVTSMVLFAPMACVSLLFLYRTRKKEWGVLFGSLVVSFLISKLCGYFIEVMGGFYTRGMPVGVVTPKGIFSRISEWWKSGQIKVLFGAGHGNGFLGEWNHLIAVILILGIVFSLIYCTINIMRLSPVISIFYFITVINVAACMVTDVAIFHRYLVPGWFFGVILCLLLMGEFLNQMDSKACRRFALIFISANFLFVFGYRIRDIYRQPVYGEEQRRVVEQIEQKGYGAGYGSFWCASEVSFFSEFEIPIYPIGVKNTFRLTPYIELVKTDWYEEDNKHFIIMRRTGDEFIDRELLLYILGEPDDRFETESYEVLYWYEDISQYMLSFKYV